MSDFPLLNQALGSEVTSKLGLIQACTSQVRPHF
jgi:hypothetical protein